MERSYFTANSEGQIIPRTLYTGPDALPGLPTINWSDFKAFISHKSTDILPAEQAASILGRTGLTPYLDRWDPKVNGDSPELEDYLRGLIRDIPNMLTVVSPETINSWWVPFEVGVARETRSQIATYLIPGGVGTRLDLPSYLRKWPILATHGELAQWAIATGTHNVSSVYRMSADFAATVTPMEITRLEQEGRVRFVG